MTGAILGLIAVLLPMVGVILGLTITINKTNAKILEKLEELGPTAEKE